eukprot:3184910-Rhodomonas_salina.1
MNKTERLCAIDNTRPGSMIGYDAMGDKVWNEDAEDQPEHEQHDSSEDGDRHTEADDDEPEDDDEQLQVPLHSRQSKTPPACTVSPLKARGPVPSGAAPVAAPVGDQLQTAQGRLSFQAGSNDGDQRLIELMRSILEEGESHFVHGQGGAAFLRIAAVCNTFPLFQSAAGEGLLSVLTIKKKLHVDWIPHYSKQSNGTVSMTG